MESFAGWKKMEDGWSWPGLREHFTYRNEYGGRETIITAYVEHNGSLFVPRYYDRGETPELIEGKYLEKAEFRGELKDTQIEMLKGCSDKISKMGGVIVVPCGYGKTVLALYIIAKMLKRKAAILVSSSALADQWMREVSTFTNCTSSIIQGPKQDFSSDISICLVQTLVSRGVSVEDQKDIGIVIVDECDNFAANTFNKAIGYFGAKWRIGLTATELRMDGNSQVFHYHLGPVIYKKGLWERKPTILRVDTNIKIPSYGQLPEYVVKAKIAKHDERNRFIASIIDASASNGRQILVLSDRKKHLHNIAKHTSSKHHMFYGSDLIESIPLDVPVIFSTLTKSRRALSIKRLDMLILCVTIGEVKQACGRIVRKDHGKPSYVVDLVDSGSGWEKKWGRRLKQYMEEDWKVYKYDPTTKETKRIN